MNKLDVIRNLAREGMLINQQDGKKLEAALSDALLQLREERERCVKIIEDFGLEDCDCNTCRGKGKAIPCTEFKDKYGTHDLLGAIRGTSEKRPAEQMKEMFNQKPPHPWTKPGKHE